MSPEILENLPYDHTADIYSLGIVLCEMSSQILPYTNKAAFLNEKGEFKQNGVLLKEAIIHLNLRPSIGSCPDAYRSLVRRILNKNPQDRPNIDLCATILRKIQQNVNELLGDEGKTFSERPNRSSAELNSSSEMLKSTFSSSSSFEVSMRQKLKNESNGIWIEQEANSVSKPLCGAELQGYLVVGFEDGKLRMYHDDKKRFKEYDGGDEYDQSPLIFVSALDKAVVTATQNGTVLYRKLKSKNLERVELQKSSSQK